MSHNVEKMFFTGKKPWWYGNSCQGTAIGVDLGENAVTSEIALKEASLDWDCLMARSAFLDESTVDIDDNPIWREAEGEKFLIRSSDRSVLGRCTGSYEPYQNREAFRFLDGLVEEGDLLYHTAGQLEGGKRVWILAQTPDSWTIQRKSGAVNHHHAFLLAMLGHTGDIGINLMPTDVRAECANTVGFADSRAEGENLIFRVPHRGDIPAKLELAAKAIEVMRNETGARRELLQAMAQTAMDSEEFIDFATSIFLGLDGDVEEIEKGVADFYEKASDRSKTIMENKVAKATGLFVKGQGNEGDTVYDALQGFTEFFDHFDLDHVKDQIQKGKQAAKAVTSSWVGAGAQRKSLVYKRLAERVRR